MSTMVKDILRRSNGIWRSVPENSPYTEVSLKNVWKDGDSLLIGDKLICAVDKRVYSVVDIDTESNKILFNNKSCWVPIGILRKRWKKA